MRAALTCLLLVGLVPLAAAPRSAPAQDLDHATAWYLRHSGWAVNLGEALLIFDYQESMGMEDVTAETPRDIQNGFIDPAEIGDLDVYVFVTHAHGDHYDPVIFEWQGEIENLTYIIGWEEEPESHCARFVGPEAECYALGGLRSTVELGEMQVYTVDSDHNDIPEVAYLVRYGGWVLYHNGDYMGDPPADYAYLKTVSDRIDLAFVSGVPGRAWPHVARAALMAREFAPTMMFATHFRDDEMCRSFMTEMEADGVETEIVCPSRRGQHFTVAKEGIVEARRTRQHQRGLGGGGP